MTRRRATPEPAPPLLDLSGIPRSVVDAIMKPPQTATMPAWVQSRLGEERRQIAPSEALRAIYSSRWFWNVAAEFPRNDLATQQLGRPADYPDWLPFLMDCLAGVFGIATRQRAVAYFADFHVWAKFVEDVDDWVPEGFTRLTDVHHSQSKREQLRRPRAGTGRTAPGVVALPRRRKARRRTPSPQVDCVPPSNHHLSYFALRWRGFRKENGRQVPVEHTDPWHGVRDRVLSAFRREAVAQAQAMGLFDPTKPFRFKDPDPTQYEHARGPADPGRGGPRPPLPTASYSRCRASAPHQPATNT